jgi:hypothetical protein
MTITEDVYTRLNADTTFKALVTGGLYYASDIPHAGINRETVPAAYSASKRLNPICVVRGRAVTPTRFLRDASGQYTSTRQIIELWFYQDGSLGWAALTPPRDRAYVLLQELPVSGTFSLTLDNRIDEDAGMRDEDMANACFLRDDYEAIGRLTTA